MASYDIFNGDADGICALQQLRLAQPRESQLITGVKRDIALVTRVSAAAGDELTVLDVSLVDNRDALLRSLAVGARCLYFDHHFPGDIPVHPNLEVHIRYTSGVCTSLLVDDYLGGRFRGWAVAAAFGDNLAIEAAQAAGSLNLDDDELATLRELGECLNYNAYGDSVEDLHFHPAALYRRLHPYADPLEFAARDPALGTLREGLRDDLARVGAVTARLETPMLYLLILPDAAWARRVQGVWANRLATSQPHRAHAVLIEAVGGYRISVRAPVAKPEGADRLCRRFPSGGGRPAAAGINLLPRERLADFESAFAAGFVTAG